VAAFVWVACHQYTAPGGVLTGGGKHSMLVTAMASPVLHISPVVELVILFIGSSAERLSRAAVGQWTSGVMQHDITASSPPSASRLHTACCQYKHVCFAWGLAV
jgi:hypothetical protein